MSTLNVSGITTLSNKTIIYGTTQTQPRLSLTGIEYYTGANTNNDGIGFLLGVNRTDNRQLFICDTAKTAINTTNPVMRLGISGAGTFIDSTATDGLTRLQLNLGGGAFNCQANTYGSMNKVLKFHNVQVADDRRRPPPLENTSRPRYAGVCICITSSRTASAPWCCSEACNGRICRCGSIETLRASCCSIPLSLSIGVLSWGASQA